MREGGGRLVNPIFLLYISTYWVKIRFHFLDCLEVALKFVWGGGFHSIMWPHRPLIGLNYGCDKNQDRLKNQRGGLRKQIFLLIPKEIK
jgi:hypothetical protein